MSYYSLLANELTEVEKSLEPGAIAQEASVKDVPQSASKLGDFIYKNLSLSLISRHFDEANIDRATLVGPHANMQAGLYLGENESFIFDIVGIQEFGSSQSRFGENVPSNGIFADEAYFKLRPNDKWQIDVGVINQAWLQNELLFSSQPFPALRFFYDLKAANKLKTTLFFQYAMPTTTRIKTRTGANQEEPSSLAVGLSHARQISKWQGKAHVYYYTIDDLPSEVAVESSLFGNTVNIPTTDTATFREDFAGLSFVLDLEYMRDDYTILLILKSLKNLATSSGFGFGQVVEFGATYLLQKKEQTLKFVYFFNESDTSVASFNSYEYGHSNRLGYGLSLKHQFRESLAVKFKYITSKTINSSNVQNDITFWNLAATWTF